MTKIDVASLRKIVADRNFKWRVGEPPADFRERGLGWEPSPPELNRAALANAQRLMLTRMPEIFSALSMRSAILGAPAAAPALPRRFDWRDRGVIGPVTDQRWCGSCVSFACVGLVASMAAIEQAITPPDLSEADSHFNSSHGATCGGWYNATCLDQIKTRGVASAADFAYMNAFDSPPVNSPNPNDPNDLWGAHVRTIADRNRKIYKIAEVTAWTGDARKTYLANVGPLVCGFKVYEDFQGGNYMGGVYKHATGVFKGGHAVLVIGYDDDAEAWICRNSWGTGFGGAADPDGTGAGFFMLGYGECNIDDEAFYGCQGVITPASNRWRGWWPVQGGVAAANSSVFGASRAVDKLDIFTSGTDHGTYNAAWQAGDTNWRGWAHVQGGITAPGTSISAISRRTDHLDIFCVGTDHRIFTAAWQPGDTAFRGWWPVQGGVAAPNSNVFGVSRSLDKLDIFCVGTDRRIYATAWQAGAANWQPWAPVQGGVAAPNTSVTAVSRRPDHLDIFCVGSDQRIYTAARTPADTQWRGWWPIQGGVAAPGTSVFGVSRGLDKLDIFCIGTDMQVYTAAWKAGDTGWRGWWPVGHFKAAPGSSVHAVSRSADRIDIFAVGADGGIYSAGWSPTAAKWRGWWRILDGAAAPGSMVTAVVRRPDFLDIFAVGTDHHIYTAAYQP